VLDLDGSLTEIRTFYSVKEIREIVEEQLSQYRMMLEDYTQWLGTLLRNPERSKDQDWAKKTTELQKVLKAGVRKGRKKEDKLNVSTEWVQFKELMLCADDFGEAEIIFEAVEQIKTNVDRLEKVKNSLADLERYGLGKDVLYVTYLHDGIPEKILFKVRKGSEVAERFKFIADFSIAK
jgi:hypothetical protein